jgi:hypothetical protein
MRTIRLMIFSVIFALFACGPTEPVVNPSNPIIERSVVPTIEETKAVIHEATSKLNDQAIVIANLGDDVDRSLEYSKFIRFYTGVDERGVKLSDDLDYSLNTIKRYQTHLITSNDFLVNDMIKSSNALQGAMQLAARKDEESVKWQQANHNKDQVIIKLNKSLSNQINKSAALHLDLENARTYKHIVIVIGSMVFLFAIIKMALTIWSPFSKFKI